MNDAVAAAAITRTHRAEWAWVVAALTKRFGDLDIAEEAAAEAFASAVARWPTDGVPPNPGAWLTTTANRKAIDRIRRESKRDDKHKEAQLLSDDDPPEPVGAIDDERLRLIFTCCHPALAMQTRVALTLRMVGGLTVPEIARAFLVQENTVGQRITRAKAKIKAARIPYRVPAADDLPARVSGVLAVLFLVFNEGYLATGSDTGPVRHDLTAEAIRLARLVRALLPQDGEVAGLLALMLLTEARRSARVSTSGELVTLTEQDRGAWDAALVAEGHRLVRERLVAAAAGVAPGRYQILAAINAVHTSAREARDTDWSQIVALYDQLVRLDPSPIVALNRAVAVAELDGPEVALAAVDRLENALAGYHAYHATRADLLRRVGRSQASAAAYDRAIELAGNSAEIAYLTPPPRPTGSGPMTIELMSGTEAAALRAQPLTYTGSLTDRGGAPDGYPTFSRTRLLAPSTDFATAVQALMTWQVQARSGLHVVASSPEVELDAVVVMSVGVGRAALRIPCRVVDVIDEPHRHGFSYGTLPGHPESGEETFVLRQHEDESVTFTVWAFSRAASPLARLGGPLTRQAQRFMTRRYLHVLDRRPRAVPGGGSRSSPAG